jgi:hypothetical protein
VGLPQKHQDPRQAMAKCKPFEKALLPQEPIIIDFLALEFVKIDA